MFQGSCMLASHLHRGQRLLGSENAMSPMSLFEKAQRI